MKNITFKAIKLFKSIKYKSTFDKADLKKRLSPLEYNVTQEKGTERPFTGEYWNNKESGIYSCIVCDNELFKSEHKFDSGTGWPSFYEKSGEIEFKSDLSYGMERVEVVCNNCNAHLGHFFKDGPNNKRYCINSCSLFFKKNSENI